MKTHSTLLARNRRPFTLWRDRGKAILELTRVQLDRKRRFMARLPDLRFFAGVVLIVSSVAGGPLAPLVAATGGTLLVFYDS